VPARATSHLDEGPEPAANLQQAIRNLFIVLALPKSPAPSHSKTAMPDAAPFASAR